MKLTSNEKINLEVKLTNVLKNECGYLAEGEMSYTIGMGEFTILKGVILVEEEIRGTYKESGNIVEITSIEKI